MSRIMEINPPEGYGVKVIPPEGYKIDEENSTFGCIRFKPKRWRDNENALMNGYYISSTDSDIDSWSGKNVPSNYCMFSSKKQAKSALAMARISQIMANDARFGGPITDEEWESSNIKKYVIQRVENSINTSYYAGLYRFLAFHTEEQRALFLKENEDLIKDYFML